MKNSNRWFEIALAAAILACPVSSLAAAPFITCTPALRDENCEVGKKMVGDILRQFGIEVQEWRWVLVARDNWPQAAAAMGAQARWPGFTILTTRTTYLEDPSGTIDGRALSEKFRHLGHLAGPLRLQWLVAHELGHILCGAHQESDADLVGDRLRFHYTGDVCRGVRRRPER